MCGSGSSLPGLGSKGDIVEFESKSRRFWNWRLGPGVNSKLDSHYNDYDLGEEGAPMMRRTGLVLRLGIPRPLLRILLHGLLLFPSLVGRVSV